MTTTLTTLALLLALALPGAAQEVPYRVLLPVFFEQPIPGALGSQWKTALAIHNPTANQFHIDWCAGSTIPFFDACSLPLLGTAHLTPGETQGVLPPFSGSETVLNTRGGPRQLYIRPFLLPVGAPSQLSFQLRALDISRSATNAGTEVPVVRQEQFRTAKTNLLNVPGDPNFRLTLRLYELTLKVASFTIRVYDQATNALAGEGTIELSFGFEHHHRSMFEPPHVQIGDMTQLVPAGTALPAMMRIEIEPRNEGSEFWGFVSITNNETQHLTLVTPQ